MKKIILLTIMLFSLSILFGIKSLPSETVGFSKATCVDYTDMDYHNISVPFQGDLVSVTDLDPEGLNFHSISRWEPENQKWITSTFKSEIGNWQQIFPIHAGQSYSIHDLQKDFEFSTSGTYEVLPPYNLIFNDSTHSMNFIMVPLEKYNLYWAGNDLGNEIGSCSQIGKFDPKRHFTRITTFDGLAWAWDFPIKISDPLMVFMTDNVIWPITDSLKFNLPKANYWRVVRRNLKNYDFNGKVDDVTFKAWITGREDDIITQETLGCGFEQINDSLSTIFVNLGNFINCWEPNDEINLEVIEQSSKDKSNCKMGKGSCIVDNSGDTIYRGFESLIKGSGEPIVIGDPISTETNIPFETKLYQNYPNPFNPITTIKFSLKDESKVSLKVYNYTGQLVKTLVNEQKEQGYHKIHFDASQLSSGVYYYTLKTDKKKFTKKMLMVK